MFLSVPHLHSLTLPPTLPPFSIISFIILLYPLSVYAFLFLWLLLLFSSRFPILIHFLCPRSLFLSLLKALSEIQRRFCSDGAQNIPLLDPVTDMGISSETFLTLANRWVLLCHVMSYPILSRTILSCASSLSTLISCRICMCVCLFHLSAYTFVLLFVFVQFNLCALTDFCAE